MPLGNRLPPVFGPRSSHPFRSHFFNLWFSTMSERNAFDKGIAKWLEEKFGISFDMEE